MILTCGYSSTVLHFLMEVARRNRKFEVIVSEMAPSLEGHGMAQVPERLPPHPLPDPLPPKSATVCPTRLPRPKPQILNPKP